MKWFKHDSDASMDAKLQEVLLDYGLEGYGLYWYCLELITGKVSADNITFELEHDARIIARNTGSTAQKVTEMMMRFIKLGLFEYHEGNLITCYKVAKRMDSSMTSNTKLRELIKDIHKTGILNHKPSIEPVTPPQITESHDGVMTESCKKRREEKRKEEDTVGYDFLKWWNTTADKYGLKLVRKINKDRNSKIKSRIKDSELLTILGDIENEIKRSQCLREASWFSLDWIIKNETNILKVLEGNYRDKNTQPTLTTQQKPKQPIKIIKGPNLLEDYIDGTTS